MASKTNALGVDVSGIYLIRKCRNKACGKMMVNPLQGQLACDEHPISSDTEPVKGTFLNGLINSARVANGQAPA